MAAQEGGGFFDIERPHGGIPAGGTSTALAGDSHHADSPTATPVESHPSDGNSEPIRAQHSKGCARHSTIEKLISGQFASDDFKPLCRNHYLQSPDTLPRGSSVEAAATSHAGVRKLEQLNPQTGYRSRPGTRGGKPAVGEPTICSAVECSAAQPVLGDRHHLHPHP